MSVESVIVATATLNSPLSITNAKVMGPTGFGAYGSGATLSPSAAFAVKKPSAPSAADVRPGPLGLQGIGYNTTAPFPYRYAFATSHYLHQRNHPKWSDEWKTKIMMRSVSRGIVGAMFYAGANIVGTNLLRTYNPQNPPENWLQHIVRFIDNTAGKAIEGGVKALHFANPDKAAVAKMAKAFVTFRDTRNYDYGTPGHIINGRTLAHEMAAVTFDMGMMSWADYFTRASAETVDPNGSSKWIKDGHFDLIGGAKNMALHAVKGFTYAAGEDIMVALPYVFMMRGQRNLIDKYSPGFKYDADRGRNGASYKADVDKNGNVKIVGDYQLEGMLDLMGRFTWYNVGTKMFREAYNKLESKFIDWWDTEKGNRKIHLPKLDPTMTAGDMLKKSVNAVAGSIRYFVRTSLKVSIYMIPATFFYFITRTPQTKSRALIINGKHGLLGREGPEGILFRNPSDEQDEISAGDQSNGAKPQNKRKGKDSVVYKSIKVSSDIEGERKEVAEAYEKDITSQLNALREKQQENNLSSERGGLTPEEIGQKATLAEQLISLKDPAYREEFGKSSIRLVFRDNKGKKEFVSNNPFDDTPLKGIGHKREHPFLDKTNGYYKDGVQAPWYEKIFNPIGRKCYQLGEFLQQRFEPVAGKLNVSKDVSKKFWRTYADAAISYTPYFMMKTDTFTALWETPRMDMALDRLLNGFVNFNPLEIKNGISEVMQVIMRQPFKDVEREREAKWRMSDYTGERASNEANQLSDRRPDYNHRSAATARAKIFATEDKKVKRPTFTQLRTAPASWAAQEADRSLTGVPAGHTVQ